MKDPRRMAVLLNDWDIFQQSWIHDFVQGGPSCAIDSVQVICFMSHTINKKAANGGASYSIYRCLYSGNAAGNPFAKPSATVFVFSGALRRFIVALKMSPLFGTATSSSVLFYILTTMIDAKRDHSQRETLLILRILGIRQTSLLESLKYQPDSQQYLRGLRSRG